jgi:hypothetical protein
MSLVSFPALGSGALQIGVGINKFDSISVSVILCLKSVAYAKSLIQM